jgi:predicted nucleotidyltransferase
MRPEEALAVIGKLNLRKYGVRRIGLFGSFVRGEDTERSDVDVG